MNDFSKVCFQGTFRDYQQKILENANVHLQDRKIHIVAAPGSGKTILGLELIRGLGKPALILSPSVTIRQQWGERFESSFLPEGAEKDGYLSYDIKQPQLLTSITYQALHSAWNKLQLQEDDGEDAEASEDFSGFDLLQTVKNAGIATICLDEAHHLRSEWQKALEAFIKAMGSSFTLIALTATPPYDSNPAEWERYHSMCGDIDDEIQVPQLVAQKTLCPHQDYVIFGYPTPEEQEELNSIRKNKEEFLKSLDGSEVFAQACEQAGIMDGSIDREVMFDRAEDYVSLLAIASKTVTLPVVTLPKQLYNDAKKTAAKLSRENYRQACQLIIDEKQTFGKLSETFRHKLERASVIERGKVVFDSSSKADKTLISSLGKLQSIERIAKAELQNLGEKLRMLVLTDYIGAAHMSEIGTDAPVNSMGAVQIFEYLRRAEVPELAVLSGAGVIMTNAAAEKAASIAEKQGTAFTLKPLGETGYTSLNVSGSNKNKVALVTEAFGQGLFKVLIGTKALLGEGWDSPCINSLVLASFVGSFMLSNQMRGRAIRTDKTAPGKASNIFHLVTLDPETLRENELSGADWNTVMRRFDTFTAPAYNSDVIESGVKRLDVITPSYNAEGVERINAAMLALAADREGMKARWESSFNNVNAPQKRVMENAVEVESVPRVFTDKVKSSVGKIAAVTAAVAAGSQLLFFLPLPLRIGLSALAAAIGIPFALSKNKKAKQMSSNQGTVKIIADAVCETLKSVGTLESRDCKPNVSEENGRIYASLSGGTSREQQIFTQAMSEVLSPIDDPRYIIIQGNNAQNSFACPSAVGNKKENAELFASLLNRTAKDFRVVYTRNEKGRAELEKCKKSAAINKSAHVSTKKKF